MQAGTLTFPFKQKIPFTDDIDRLMCVSDDYDDPTSVGRFWLMKPTNDTFVDFINGFIVDVCDSCGRDILDSDRLKTAAIKCATIADRCELPLEWTPDVPVFVSHVYGGAFIVTPETYEKIRKADVVNYDAKVVTVV